MWKRVQTLLKIEFDTEPVSGDNDKYIKTKIKIYSGSMIKNFQSKKMPKEPCNYLLIIMLGSVIKAKKKYYPQAPLEEFKNEKRR